MELLRDRVDPNYGNIVLWGRDVQMPIDYDFLLVDLGGIYALDISGTKLSRNRYGLPKITNNLTRNRASSLSPG